MEGTAGKFIHANRWRNRTLSLERQLPLRLSLLECNFKHGERHVFLNSSGIVVTWTSLDVMSDEVNSPHVLTSRL
jgi:hypothetical protein